MTLSLDSAIVTSKGNMCRHKKKRDGNREGREGGTYKEAGRGELSMFRRGDLSMLHGVFPLRATSNLTR